MKMKRFLFLVVTIDHHAPLIQTSREGRWITVQQSPSASRSLSERPLDNICPTNVSLFKTTVRKKAMSVM